VNNSISNKCYSRCHKATEKEDERETLGKEIWRGTCGQRTSVSARSGLVTVPVAQAPTPPSKNKKNYHINKYYYKYYNANMQCVALAVHFWCLMHLHERIHDTFRMAPLNC